MSRVFPLGQALAEQSAPRDHSVTHGVDLAERATMRPLFPASNSLESDVMYFAEHRKRMMEWVALVMDDVKGAPPPERYCLAYVEHFAMQELGRPMREAEKTLVFRCVQDFRNACLTLRRYEQAGGGR